MEERMDLKMFFQMMKHRALTIVATTVIVTALSALVVFVFMKPQYEASDFIIIGKQESKDSYTEIQQFNRMIVSSTDLIKRPFVLNEVKTELGLKEDIRELNEKISVQNKKDSQLIQIVVKDTDQKEAKRVAHAVTETSAKKIDELLKVKNVKMLNASADEVAVEKAGNPYLNLAIGAVVGLFLGLGLAIIRESLED